MTWLTASGTDLWQAAAKAALLFLVAVLGFRFGERRTIAELAPVDVVAIISAGAVVGRTATASGTGFLVGAVALVTVLVVHRLVVRLRRLGPLRTVFDQPILLLIAEGEVQRAELRRTGLTLDDLYAVLRARGVARVSDVRYLFYENKGAFSLVTWDQDLEVQPVAAALDEVGRRAGAPPSRTED